MKQKVATVLFSKFPILSERWARNFRAVKSSGVPWTAFTKEPSECCVAVVTTAGVHMKGQVPFDMADENGDYTFREIRGDVKDEELTITHKYYDHTDADRDINIVFPIDRLREMVGRREIGRLAPRHFGFMGHILGDKIKPLIEITAPDVARMLREDSVDIVLLTPG